MRVKLSMKSGFKENIMKSCGVSQPKNKFLKLPIDGMDVREQLIL